MDGIIENKVVRYVPEGESFVCLFSSGKDSMLAIALIFIPICISYYYKIKAKATLVNSAASPARELEYYHKCISGREFFKETRILGAVPFFRNLYEHTLGGR